MQHVDWMLKFEEIILQSSQTQPLWLLIELFNNKHVQSGLLVRKSGPIGLVPSTKMSKLPSTLILKKKNLNPALCRFGG